MSHSWSYERFDEFYFFFLSLYMFLTFPEKFPLVEFYVYSFFPFCIVFFPSICLICDVCIIISLLFDLKLWSYLQILLNYEDILRKNQFLEEKSKLKSILAGLIRCLSLLPCDERDQSAVKNVFSGELLLISNCGVTNF